MTEVQKAIGNLANMISRAAKDAVSDAPFDKTFFGIVTDNSGGYYTIESTGQKYKIRSSQYFAVNERVAVTAVQSNYNTLIIHKL